MSKNPVVHFEMPAKDKSRVSQFYEKAFGWKMIQSGPEFGNYLIAQTADTDENNMVQTPGTINGGFFDYKDEPGFRVPHLIISVENLDEAMQAVKDNGGTNNGQPMDIVGIGKYVSFNDSEENNVGLLQATNQA